MARNTVLVCDGDDVGRRVLSKLVVDHGFEVVGDATTAIDALHMLEVTPADVVVIVNELQGMSGLEATPELLDAGSEVVLVSPDPLALQRAREHGAFAAVDRGDFEGLEQALDRLAEADGQVERRSGVDRRLGTDRRVAQDWSKVVRERRSGVDRRCGNDRRRTEHPPADPV